MASTWLKPLHVRKDRSILQAITERTKYAKNPEKTDGGMLVKGYECDPRSVDEEFWLSKRKYEHITGRNNGMKNVIGYHFRQSFKPGEITPEETLDVGYETALRWTKGKHAFIVCVHTDRKHIHCAVIFNSTTLDCTGKFNNFKNSSFAIRRLSDLVCAEHGLSVIENPKPSKGKNYGKWLGEKEPTWQDKLRQKIDEALPKCQTFPEFLTYLKSEGYKVRDNRKYISLTAPQQKRAWRLRSLGEQYTEEAIRERLGITKIITAAGAGGGHQRVSLLIDIQAKIREGKGAGYEHWARIFNIKEAARTLIFLKETGIDSYDDLVKRTASISSEFNERLAKIKTVENRLNDISTLQKQIGVYGKTRDIYARYIKNGKNPAFFEEHRAEIALHQAAKNHFNSLGIKKLPTIADLKKEYAILNVEKKKLYTGYHDLKAKSRELLIAKGNADRMLGIKPTEQNREADTTRSQRGGEIGDAR